MWPRSVCVAHSGLLRLRCSFTGRLGVFEPLQEFTAATPGFHFQTQIVFTNRSDHRRMSHTTGLKQYDMIQCDAVSSDSLTEGHPAWRRRTVVSYKNTSLCGLIAVDLRMTHIVDWQKCFVFFLLVTHHVLRAALHNDTLSATNSRLLWMIRQWKWRKMASSNVLFCLKPKNIESVNTEGALILFSWIITSSIITIFGCWPLKKDQTRRSGEFF